MPSKIPNRWLPYKACGKVIEGTQIICFKVPLRARVQEKLKEIEEIWDVKSVLARIPGLKAVIDLTNTARYYDPKEFEAAGVVHKKIMMAGRIIPPEDQVKQFMDIVDSFVGENEGVVVGVHCTHGLNRTGYMVCRYMRDRLGISPKDAITRFETARGYEIERANYIADLLGKKPPPPAIGRANERDPKPIGEKRSISLSDYDEPLDDMEVEKEPVANWRLEPKEPIKSENVQTSRSGISKKSKRNWRTRLNKYQKKSGSNSEYFSPSTSMSHQSVGLYSVGSNSGQSFGPPLIGFENHIKQGAYTPTDLPKPPPHWLSRQQNGEHSRDRTTSIRSRTRDRNSDDYCSRRKNFVFDYRYDY